MSLIGGRLERVASRVYRRPTPYGTAKGLRWDIAVISAQRLGPDPFYVGGMTALELHGLGHFARLGSVRTVHLYDPEGNALYDPEGNAPSWLAKLPTDAAILLHTRALFSDPTLGVEWHRFDPGTTRHGTAIQLLNASEPWDYFLRLAGTERGAIEMMAEVPPSLSFEHVDTIFEGLTTLRPRILTSLLERCASVRAKRLFLFFADRPDHG